MSRSLEYSKFFPYNSYRLGQEKYIRLLEESIKTKKNILVDAPNGSGKTVMVLSAALPEVFKRQLKLIYLCRTHTQSDRAIKELKKIYNLTAINSNQIFGLSIRGRNEMCLHKTLINLKASPTDAMAICKNLRSNNNCAYYRNVKSFNKSSLDFFHFNKPLEAGELIQLCKEKKYCPYFLAKYLMREMPVVVCNFQWILNPDIRFRFLKLLNLSLKNCILIIDECHNIIDVATDVNSHKLIPSFLTSCLTNIQEYSLPQKYGKFLRFLRNDLRQQVKNLKDETVINPNEYLSRIYRTLRLRDKNKFVIFLKDLESIHTITLESIESSQHKEISQNNIKYLVKFVSQ